MDGMDGMDGIPVRLHTAGPFDVVEQVGSGDRVRAPFASRAGAERYMALRVGYFIRTKWRLEYKGHDESALNHEDGRRVVLKVVPAR